MGALLSDNSSYNNVIGQESFSLHTPFSLYLNGGSQPVETSPLTPNGRKLGGNLDNRLGDLNCLEYYMHII